MPIFWSGWAAEKKFDADGIKQPVGSTIILNGFHGIGKGSVLLPNCNSPMAISTKTVVKNGRRKKNFVTIRVCGCISTVAKIVNNLSQLLHILWVADMMKV